MATFVLVSGAWHAGWCWERVVPLLEAQGHRVIAPDLLGMGDDKTPLPDVTLAKWTDQIAAIVAAQSEPVVLVGHSRGGIVISEVAERVPDRIASLAYLAAFLLRSEDSLGAVIAALPPTGAPDILLSHPEGTTTITPDAIGPTFYNTTAPEWVSRASERLGHEPMGVFATPLQLSEERYGQVRRAYIECTEDRAVPLSLQRAMQAKLPCDPVITLNTDHSPFYSAPEVLVSALNAVANAKR